MGSSIPLTAHGVNIDAEEDYAKRRMQSGPEEGLKGWLDSRDASEFEHFGSDFDESDESDAFSETGSQYEFEPRHEPRLHSRLGHLPGDDEDECEGEASETDATAGFIMNQKSLADKAPGALQHSFAHRAIPLPRAFQMRFLQFIIVCAMALLSAGLPFGFPAMRQLLAEEGVWLDLCEPSQARGNAPGQRFGCAIQDSRLAVLEVTGWVTWMIAGWIGVRAVQGWGLRATGLAGTAGVLAGCLYLALSLPNEGEYWLPVWARLYILPTLLISAGSALVLLACLHYVRLFPKRTSLLHSLIFLAQDMSGVVMYLFYESRSWLSLRTNLLMFSVIMTSQLFVWLFLFDEGRIPTIRFSVTLWHQRPLLVDQQLPQHVASPYFGLGLSFAVVIFAKIFFYMSTVQMQLRLLLMPTMQNVTPEDFSYHPDEAGVGRYGLTSTASAASGFFYYIPFFAEQPGGTSSNVLSLRQFTYNPMQPEIFLDDLQEMLYFLMPTAAMVTVFWMRVSMSDWKVSSALLFSTVAFIIWGFVQNRFTVRDQAFAAMIFPVFRSVFLSGIYEYCERVFGCQHFHFTFWFLHACAGVVLALPLPMLVYWTVRNFERQGLFESVNFWLNAAVGLVGIPFIWVLKCNNL